MNQTNFSPFDFFLDEGMTRTEAAQFAYQIIEELRGMNEVGVFKTITAYPEYTKERAYEMADQWLSDHMIAKYNVK